MLTGWLDGPNNLQFGWVCDVCEKRIAVAESKLVFRPGDPSDRPGRCFIVHDDCIKDGQFVLQLLTASEADQFVSGELSHVEAIVLSGWDYFVDLGNAHAALVTLQSPLAR